MTEQEVLDKALGKASPSARRRAASVPAPRWHYAPTLAGNPRGRMHYDIGGDDGSNVALVYPSEDGIKDTLRKARLIAAAPETAMVR